MDIEGQNKAIQEERPGIPTGSRRRELTETEKAYIAGIIDGEGYVGIYRKMVKGCHNLVYESVLVVSMWNEEVIRWVHERIGGSFFIHPDKRGYGYEYRVTLTRKSAVAALEMVRPYLMVKANKADLLIRLEGLRKPGKHTNPREAEAIYLESLPPWKRTKILKSVEPTQIG